MDAKTQEAQAKHDELKALALRTKAEIIEQEIRASQAYNDLRRAINELNWPLRVAREEIERCRKNEEARERREYQKVDPGLKALKAVREKLNAILEDEKPFTWEP